MKLIYAIILAMFCWTSQAALTNINVVIAWDYPPDGLSTDLWFNVYQSGAISPLSGYTLITNTIGTVTQLQMNIGPSNQFFYVTASNSWWGESVPSNIASPMKIPLSSTNTTIHKK